MNYNVHVNNNPTTGNLSNPIGHGIFIGNGCDTVTIIKNKVKKIPSDGIIVSAMWDASSCSNKGSTNVSIIGNRVDCTSGTGLTLEKVDHAMVSGNVFNGNGYSGAYVMSGKNLQFSVNTFKNNGNLAPGVLESGLLFEGYYNSDWAKCGAWWENVSIVANTFDKGTHQTISINLDNGDKYMVNDNIFLGYTSGYSHVQRANTGLKRMMEDNAEH